MRTALIARADTSKVHARVARHLDAYLQEALPLAERRVRHDTCRKQEEGVRHDALQPPGLCYGSAAQHHAGARPVSLHDSTSSAASPP
jgi:hypothetical protein